MLCMLGRLLNQKNNWSLISTFVFHNNLYENSICRSLIIKLKWNGQCIDLNICSCLYQQIIQWVRIDVTIGNMKLPDHVYEEHRRQPRQFIFRFNQNTNSHHIKPLIISFVFYSPWIIWELSFTMSYTHIVFIPR